MRETYFKYLIKGIADTFTICREELKNVLRDSGVLLILVFAGIAYPILYNLVYLNEETPDLNVAVVDFSGSAESRSFTRNLDATNSVKVIQVADMEEAKEMFVNRDVHAILLFPEDYATRMARGEQAVISLYQNMGCFLIYKNIALAVNHVMLDEMKSIQLNRYAMGGATEEQANQMVTALPYEENVLFNPGSGFASFFVPVILMIIIHQLLFLGIGMSAGTEREEGRRLKYYNGYFEKRYIYRVILGKSAAYFLIYSFLAAYIALFIPLIFNLPHFASPWDIYRMLVPFLLATIFFSMTCSIFIRNRETGMVLFLFFSVILVFLSGFTWPVECFPKFWKYFAYIFPSTFGTRAYVKLQCMAADFHIIIPEYIALWIQAGIYMVTACLVANYRMWRMSKGDKKFW